MIRRIEAMHLEAHVRFRHIVEQPPQALDIGRLLHGMNEALVPDPARMQNLPLAATP